MEKQMEMASETTQNSALRTRFLQVNDAVFVRFHRHGDHCVDHCHGNRKSAPAGDQVEQAHLPLFCIKELRVGVVFLAYGLITIGLICNLIAMKFYPLSKEKMAEIQDEIVKIKAKAMAEA